MKPNHMQSKGFISELVHNKILYLMVLPGILFIIVFAYLPMAGLRMAFTDYNVVDGIFGSPFNGIENFKFFFTSSNDWWRVTRNTLLLNSYFLIAGLVFQIGIAIILNEIKGNTFKKITQSFMFFPYFLSWVVIGAIIYSLFSTDVGVVNTFLKSLGLDPVRWYAEAKFWRSILVGTNIWKWTGYGSIIYLAAMSNFDPALYEAATVDGASKLKQLWHITLPLLLPTAITLTLFSIGRIFYGDFTMIYGIIQQNGTLLDTTEVIDVYVFGAMRSLGFSISSAIGLYQSIMGFILIVISNKVAKKLNDGNGLF